MQFRKFELIPTLALIASLIMFIMLGTWQMQRLQWKQAVMMETATKRDMPVLTSLPEDMTNLTYRRAALSGRFLYDHVIHLIGRQQGMNVGYYLITPLQLADGRVLLVNRGFSPLGKESKPLGKVKVEGLFRPLREHRYFAPPNAPDKNIWSWEDREAIGKMVGKEPLPLVLEVTGKMEENVYPVPNEGKVVYRNDHLGYAITWYLLALTSVVMFVFYYHKK